MAGADAGGCGVSDLAPWQRRMLETLISLPRASLRKIADDIASGRVELDRQRAQRRYLRRALAEFRKLTARSAP